MDKLGYELNIRKVCDCLKNNHTKEVIRLISALMEYDMDAAEPHNLLGIYYEISGNDNAARRHYRAAYALDPTYKPACRNLDRICSWSWFQGNPQYDFGDITIKKDSFEEERTYFEF